MTIAAAPTHANARPMTPIAVTRAERAGFFFELMVSSLKVGAEPLTLPEQMGCPPGGGPMETVTN